MEIFSVRKESKEIELIVIEVRRFNEFDFKNFSRSCDKKTSMLCGYGSRIRLRRWKFYISLWLVRVVKVRIAGRDSVGEESWPNKAINRLTNGVKKGTKVVRQEFYRRFQLMLSSNNFIYSLKTVVNRPSKIFIRFRTVNGRLLGCYRRVQSSQSQFQECFWIFRDVLDRGKIETLE